MKKELAGRSFELRIPLTLEAVEDPGLMEDRGPVEGVLQGDRAVLPGHLRVVEENRT